jgi:hypothetical protein
MLCIGPTANHRSIRLFFSFASSTHTHTHAYIASLSYFYTHIYSHLPESRTRTDKREKLTLYARFQSVCRPPLREASDRMIIAFRLFVRCLHFLVHPIHSSVRPYSATNGQTDASAFSMYVCICVLVFIVLRSNRRVLSLGGMYPAME